ncbi:RagB/SusD family nutrient uptake outer membrane protein [Mucilaginibacter ginsenosidivorans]|uniref:RagB/SusD family nutrient uptake outer membrane protein n=1 Tax=Mucilaginibacter ginsenosidivorans TaxID=398053 RepID=A0A5B8UTU1_9SPHI|nr:RagB/SusD family nutrient uptake outer membrane protein [Mucilaginibacter ginsenosidivorans]QEC62527.1 RagB/SusD family nutrient uptake outer membrane protein [Mucilaginibacter ginsenosidivorans]
MKMKFGIGALLLLAALWSACQKGYLEVKPSKALLVPSALGDFRALLDNLNVFNLSPGLPGIADGDFYTTDAGWAAYQSNGERNSYTWARDIFGNEPSADWNIPYQQVFYSNVVLEGLDGLGADSVSAEFRAVKGTALFSRGTAFFNLAQVFCADYGAGDPGAALGLPLRLSPDVTLRVGRSSLRETYARVLSDLRASAALLPVSVGYKSRPSRAAAWGMLARVYLAMGDYARAGGCADSCLALQGALLDYSLLDGSARRPFPRALPDGNGEVIWYCAAVPYSFNQGSSPTYVDSALYGSYGEGDLRKGLFFAAKAEGGFGFKGNYSGVLTLFSGLAADELYLVRAECRVRTGDVAGGMADLNTLLAKRYAPGGFMPLSAGDADAALALVLRERRKELPDRGTRWGDLRRLNREAAFRVELVRELNGAVYRLEPGSVDYVYPIPADEVGRSGIQQNPR